MSQYEFDDAVEDTSAEIEKIFGDTATDQQSLAIRRHLEALYQLGRAMGGESFEEFI